MLTTYPDLCLVHKQINAAVSVGAGVRHKAVLIPCEVDFRHIYLWRNVVELVQEPGRARSFDNSITERTSNGIIYPKDLRNISL